MAKPKVTIKEMKLIKATAEGKNQTEAGLAADGNRTPESARVWANQTLQKATVQEAFQEELKRQGMTVEKIVKPLVKGIEAKMVVQVEGDFFQTEVDDLTKQFQAHDRIIKIMGVGQDKTGGNATFIQINNDMRNKYV